MADTVIVTLACGCRVNGMGSLSDAPYCAEHDERRVSHVKAPPPRFRSVECEAKGPLVVSR